MPAPHTSPARSTACKARGSDIRVHYKNTREVIGAIRGMHLNRALQFLKNVIDKKEIVAFTRYAPNTSFTARSC